MDIFDFDTREKAEAGVEIPLEIMGQTLRGKDKEPVLFRIKGFDSNEVRDYTKQANKRNTGESSDADDRKDIAFCCKVCLGWSDNMQAKGKALPYSPEAAKEIFAIPAVRIALIAAVFDRQNFSKAS